MMLVAAAGPLVNIILAIVGAQVLRSSGLPSNIAEVLKWAVELNLALAIFNMIPIPPLDGSRIITGFLPGPMAVAYNRFEPYGILIVLVLLQFGLLRFIYPIVDALAALLGVKI